VNVIVGLHILKKQQVLKWREEEGMIDMQRMMQVYRQEER
jgi:hypothetical protein